MSVTRRQFIRNLSVVGGALTVGFQLTGCSDKPLNTGADADFQPNAFLRIAPDGRITMQLPKAEMGQGILTGMVTLVAEELEVAPADIEVEMAPAHTDFRDPEMYLQITGGSASIRVFYDVLRAVGASTRATLLQAAAHNSGLALEQLQAKAGRVQQLGGDFSASYGELVETARELTVPEQVSLKQPREFALIGHYDRRLDSAGKTDGSAVFGIDAGPPDCAVAVVVRCPWFDGKLLGFDESAALAVPGVTEVFAIEQGVAVVARGYWSARQGAKVVNAQFEPADTELRDSDSIEQAMRAALDSDDFANIRSEAVPTDQPPGRELVADYAVPFLAHATMEPLNATAIVTGGLCEVWVGTQAPDIARDAAARVLGVSRADVVIHNHLLGGGFGRRAAADNVAEVVAIAARLGRPVKLIWSREDDMQHDYYRPAMMGRLRATVAESGAVAGWRHDLVGPSINQQVMPEFAKAMLPSWVPGAARRVIGDLVAAEDFSAVEGAAQLPYQFAGIEINYHNLQVPVPLGYWRSVGHSHTAFVVESFIDELAAQAAIDPVAFRRQHLPSDSRQRRVLDAVAEAANWGQLPAGHFQGVAVHESFESVVAEVAEVSLRDGKLKLERFVCAVDCGQVINPDIVRDQMESGIVFALSAALYGAITIVGGAVQQQNFNDYPVLRHNEMPRVEVVILDSNDPPTGVGEPGTPPAAPALANALFAATGQRQRQLPLTLA